MFYFQEKNGLNLYKSSILDEKKLIHTFTTRTGGNTPHPLATFSMGTAEYPDMLSSVEENRKKICEVLGLKFQNLIIPQQKHTDNIKIVSSPYDDVTNCDALITQEPELVLMLLFADCVPIILYAPDKHVLSVVHAGWRGTEKSIVTKTLNVLNREFDTDNTKIIAVIGPAIGKCCYPVSPEVAFMLFKTIKNDEFADFDNEFLSLKPDLIEKDFENIFTKNINDNNLVYVDLKKLNARQLSNCGVTNIDMSDNCTSCMSSVFYSYRAEHGKTGRHAAIASLT